MAVTFRYLLNGNTVTFTQQVDIDSMKGHPEYVQVNVDLEDTPTETPKKTLGRSAKKVEAVAEVQ